MPVVIKEIHVSTVVEKKIILPEEVSPGTVELLKKAVLEELSEKEAANHTVRSDKRER